MRGMGLSGEQGEKNREDGDDAMFGWNWTKGEGGIGTGEDIGVAATINSEPEAVAAAELLSTKLNASSSSSSSPPPPG